MANIFNKTEIEFSVQIKEAESLFVEVDEEEYAKIVSKRRQDDFVEDEDGTVEEMIFLITSVDIRYSGEDLGYRDDGEEAWNRSVKNIIATPQCEHSLNFPAGKSPLKTSTKRTLPRPRSWE